ncbi:MAG: hypothetical protein HQ567_26255 [Candidatus Nealsonbacteria bacterium]|nr:hypothetical protein [Candidatus Nealsonbacteria bacterium]
MYIVLLIPILYLAAVAETALGDVMRVGDATPDLIALVAVVWLLIAAGPRAFLVAGAVALLGDLIAPGRLGVGMAWMLLVGYGVTWLRTRLKSDHLVAQVPVACAALIAWAVGVAITGRLLGDVALPLSTLLTRAAATGLYTAAVALPVLMVVGWMREPFLVRNGRLET